MDFSGLIAAYRPPSAIEEDVLESLQRKDRSRRPLRNIADCIVRDFPIEVIATMLGPNECSRLNIDEPITKGLRLLHYAVFQNNAEISSYLLDIGADPNLMDDAGYTPLHLCAEKGYIDLTHLLLHYGARLRFTELNINDEEFGEPPRASPADEPLRLAIKNGEHDMVKFLLEHGANVNAAYYLGQEINLVNSMDITSLEMLLTYGANPNARDIQGLTPLMKACRNPEAVEAVHLLISYGANVNDMTESEQRIPLHYAVLTGNLELVEILIRNGSIVNFPHEYTKPPPLYFAVLRGFLDILDYLISCGADVNAASAVVGSALHIALTEKIRNKEKVVKLLLEKGANPNAVTFSEKGPMLKPPLGEYIQCCEQPEYILVRLLLRYGAQVVLRVQRENPLGILKVIHRLHLGLVLEVMELIVEASESFSVDFILNSKQMSDEHKQMLLDRALQPFSLMQLSRIALRRGMGWGPAFVKNVESLEIPKSLKHYIFFEPT